MSCHYIYIADGAKKMRPIRSREEYLKLRNSGEQTAILKAVRSGDEGRRCYSQQRSADAKELAQTGVGSSDRWW